MVVNLEEAIDIHTHAGPSVMDRRFDALEIAREADNAGMSAIVLKDHYVPTQDIARLVDNEMRREDRSLKVYGAVCLNSSIGGINPGATEVAVKAGAKLVFLPTFDARHHRNVIEGKRGSFTPHGSPLEHVGPVDLEAAGHDGRLDAVLGIVAAHGAALATGHLDNQEVLSVIEKALSAGVDNIVVTHAQLFLDLDERFLDALLDFDVMLEVVALPTVYPEFTIPGLTRTKEEVREFIDRVGADRVILSGDLGHPQGDLPVIGLQRFIELLVAAGLSGSQIDQMIKQNPARLLGVA